MKSKYFNRSKVLKIIFVSLSLLWGTMIVFNAFGTSLKKTSNNAFKDDPFLLKKQLDSVSLKLNYPKQVQQFYNQNNYQIVWVKQDTVKSDVYMSMLLMDCVLQFGLNRNDFHPELLSYDALRPLTKPNASIPAQQIFDIYLTDALLTLINHLHYGKFNPVFYREVLETNSALKFSAVRHLQKALGERNFMSFLVSAQPQTQMYKSLQDYLHLVKGQYIDDCYEFPEGDARKMAINMERLRWLNSDESYFIHINIPSYNLKLINGDSATKFKVIVGKTATPTPELVSAITYMTTAPDWKVPHKIFVKELLPKALKDFKYFENNHYTVYDLKGNFVVLNKVTIQKVKSHSNLYNVKQSSGCDNALGKIVFRFVNQFDIYLHDTAEPSLFAKEIRALSHGCIRVENAEKLAKCLLENDNAPQQVVKLEHSLIKLETKNFTFKKPVPIKISYLTCEIEDGMLRVYPDVYKRDLALEEIMFPSAQQYVKIRK